MRAGRRPDRSDLGDDRFGYGAGVVPALVRLLAIDGFEVDVPDSKENIAEFGYAGSGEDRVGIPQGPGGRLAECGTHAFVAAEIGAYRVGEKTLPGAAVPAAAAERDAHCGPELLLLDRVGRLAAATGRSAGLAGPDRARPARSGDLARRDLPISV